mgnify:FL=1
MLTLARFTAAISLAVSLSPNSGVAETITSARYTDPTTRYDHGILGDAVEWGALEVTLDNATKRRFILPDTLVFEDTSPRLADLDQDGSPEVIVVESSLTRGARLVIYGPSGRLAQTDHIGRKNRWLAPVGAADFTGDGRLEIAMVVTPHLAGRVELLAYDGTNLKLIAATTGFTNHRIGDQLIAGGIRNCDAGPQIVLAQMPWRDIGDSPMVALELQGVMLVPMPFAVPFTDDNVAKAQACALSPE